MKSETTDETAKTQSSKVLFKLDIIRLFKVGISSNYLKGLGIVVAFIATLFQYIEDIFSNLFNVDVGETYLNQIPETLGYITGFIVFIVILAFMVTVLRSVLKYFDLRITKVNKEFEVEYGLFKRINQVVKKSKTQVFEIEQNPIKDLFKIKNIFISQASSEEVSQKKKIGLVGVSDEEINIIFHSLFDLSFPQSFVNFNSSWRLMYRLMIRYFILSIGIGIGLYFWQGLILAISFSLILLFIFGVIAYKTVQKSHIGVNDSLIEIHSGSIHTNKKYIAIHKIQSIALKRNWFQQSNQHADLMIYTASGEERVSYLKLEDVLKVINYLNYKVESSQLSWIKAKLKANN